MTSTEDFLNTPMGAVPKPPVIPAGHWLGTITNHKVGTRKFETEEVHVLTLVIRLSQPDKDVDPDLLEEFDHTKAFTSMDFNMDPNGQRRFDRLLVSGFGENASGSKIAEYLPLLIGKSVVFLIKHTQSKKKNDDGEFDTYANCTELKMVSDE